MHLTGEVHREEVISLSLKPGVYYVIRSREQMGTRWICIAPIMSSQSLLPVPDFSVQFLLGRPTYFCWGWPRPQRACAAWPSLPRCCQCMRRVLPVIRGGYIRYIHVL